MSVVKYKSIFLSVSCVMVLLSAWAVWNFGFKLGIDFTGGSLWQIKIEDSTIQEVRDFFEKDLSLKVEAVSYDSLGSSYSLSFKEISDSERQLAMERVKERFVGSEEQDFWAISPSVSDEIKTKALLAIAFVLIGISAYIAFTFRAVSQPISSWKYGVITLVTLFHDVAIPAGVFAVLSNYLGITIDTNFIVALLVVMGFSVHDTIVVFDRVRENITKSRNKNLAQVVDASIAETFKRSVNTSLTLIIVLLALYFLGPLSLKFFVLAMLIGTTVGTYSSIFVASTLLVLWEGLGGRKG